MPTRMPTPAPEGPPPPAWRESLNFDANSTMAYIPCNVTALCPFARTTSSGRA